MREEDWGARIVHISNFDYAVKVADSEEVWNNDVTDGDLVAVLPDSYDGINETPSLQYKTY